MRRGFLLICTPCPILVCHRLPGNKPRYLERNGPADSLHEHICARCILDDMRSPVSDRTQTDASFGILEVSADCNACLLR